MSLLLRVVNQPANSTTMPPSAWFDTSGGMIGRAKSAHLSLEDPDRMVSRFHAHVSFAEGTFFIEDMGSTNPALVNDRVLTVGQRLQLSDGDRIRIGAYTIAAEIQADMNPAPAANGAAADPLPSGEVAAGEDLTLLEAFKIGARIEGEIGGVPPSMMQSAGASLRQFTEGARRLLALRPPLQADSTARRRCCVAVPTRSRPLPTTPRRSPRCCTGPSPATCRDRWPSRRSCANSSSTCAPRSPPRRSP